MTQDHLSPAAREVVKPDMTPSQQAQALDQKQLSHDAVKSMAHGLPERDSVKWAAASADKVSNPAHQADFQAIQAAKSWVQNPTPETQKAAAAAAAKTDFHTPGAWVAQAAAWAAGSSDSRLFLAPRVQQGAPTIDPSYDLLFRAKLNEVHDRFPKGMGQFGRVKTQLLRTCLS